MLAYALYIGAQGAQYSDITYYFDPTLPDSHMIDVQGDAIGTLLAGANAPLFWIGAVIVGIIVPAALAYLAKQAAAKGTNQQVLPLAGAGLVCALVGGICWRMLLYMAAMHVFALY